jgi:hypothetical protein
MDIIILKQNTEGYHTIIRKGEVKCSPKSIFIVGVAEIPAGKRKSFFRRRKLNSQTAIFSRISSAGRR